MCSSYKGTHRANRLHRRERQATPLQVYAFVRVWKVYNTEVLREGGAQSDAPTDVVFVAFIKNVNIY